jgi:hypothetical protein
VRKVCREDEGWIGDTVFHGWLRQLIDKVKFEQSFAEGEGDSHAGV